jgi:hypothetical protein
VDEEEKEGGEGGAPISISSQPPALQSLWQIVDSSPSTQLVAELHHPTPCTQFILATISFSSSPLGENTWTSAKLRQALPETSIRKYRTKSFIGKYIYESKWREGGREGGRVSNVSCCALPKLPVERGGAPVQTPAVKLPSTHVDAKHAFPWVGIFEHDFPDASTDEQSPTSAAFGTNEDASQVAIFHTNKINACIKEQISARR